MLRHVSFGVANLERSAAFYDAALQHGGTDEGAPGPRAHYGEHYHAAFVVDPDGYRIGALINAAR